jgi:hypothetical protein
VCHLQFVIALLGSSDLDRQEHSRPDIREVGNEIGRVICLFWRLHDRVCSDLHEQLLNVYTTAFPTVAFTLVYSRIWPIVH